MATVVVTFIITTRFYVCKMDADYKERRRDHELSRREKRWSMNSQRLEEIVAELMKPISDVRRSFDTDLSALLEEYLTEAGLHALEAGEEDDDAGELGSAAPNFAELALLLQHSASLYGRKVDCLYQHVLSVSDSLLNSTQEANATSEEPATPGGKRKRRASGAAAAAAAAAAGGGFAAVELEHSAAARREPAAPRPPPTLPRVYVELEPRQVTDADAPLRDYAGEPIGLLGDFHVAWRLRAGLLLDELRDAAAAGGPAPRPIPLAELQAAIEAAAPPLPPPPPHRCSTPLRRDDSPPSAPVTPHPAEPEKSVTVESAPPVKRERKRRSDVKLDDIVAVKLYLSEELRKRLRTVQEFTVAPEWIAGVVENRKRHVLAERRKLEMHEPRSPNSVCTGFPGWSSAEATQAADALRTSPRAGDADSDDDGFFEQSSLGESDASRVDDSPLTRSSPPSTEAAAEWQAGVLRRAAAGAARALDVRRLGARVLRSLPDAGCEPFPRVLAAAARCHADVAGLFLATLFLANAGNVEVVPGAPLSLNSFSLRLLSTDARGYCAAAAADGHLPPPAATPR
ncbi:uncharacterized protein ACR2FA_005867 [Aphomia sociella]